MELVNLSTEPEGRLRDWLPRSLHAEKVVFLPDACPGRSPLPTGCAVHTRQSDWRQFALSDCGCGMRLLRSDLGVDALKRDAWDAVADRLRANKGRLGDLGGGNHFLDALEPYDGEQLYFLIHTGSRSESGLVDDLVDDPVAFDAQFADIVAWAADNRASVQRALEATFGTMEVVVDLPHNTFERLPDGSVIIRKGAVHVRPGECTILPSHMSGDVVLIRGTEGVARTLHSLSHGTGRTMPRGQARAHVTQESIDELRKRLLMPSGLQDASLRGESPVAYRDLDECLTLLDGCVEVLQRFAVIGYMGHLG